MVQLAAAGYPYLEARESKARSVYNAKLRLHAGSYHVRHLLLQVQQVLFPERSFNCHCSRGAVLAERERSASLLPCFLLFLGAGDARVSAGEGGGVGWGSTRGVCGFSSSTVPPMERVRRVGVSSRCGVAVCRETRTCRGGSDT